MKKLCIMITHKFPYNQDETFIENEITLLANAFETVCILAAYADDTDVQTRTLPSNVIVSRLGWSSLSAGRKLLLGIKGILHADKNIWREVKKKKEIGWKTNSLYMYGTVLEKVDQATKQLHKIIDVRSFDNCVIYSYWLLEHAFIATRIAEQFKTLLPTHVLSRAHGYDVYSYRKKYQAFPFRELIFAHLDEIFPCSQDGTDHLAKSYPQYADKIHTTYLGTADHGINKEETDGKFVLVSCSNIVGLKRVHLIAEALSMILKQGNDKFRWICIGDGDKLPDLMRLVSEELSLHDHVEFLGRIPNSQVMDIYKKRHIDMFVNVSETEGLPVSIMEAQSFGIPSIATDVGGTSEIVKNDVGCLLPKDITSSHLAEHLKQFMDLSFEEREMYRIRARGNWLVHFNAEKNFKEWAIKLSSLFD